MRRKSQYLLCVSNGGNDDLTARKLYEILPDARAHEEGLVRVIDDSEEDYLYPRELFVAIALPKEAATALADS